MMTILVEIQTVDGPVRASIDDSLIWTCDADGIRRMLQALVPPDELVGSTPQQPSYLGEVMEITQSMVPLRVLSVVEEEAGWDPEAVY